MLHGLLHHVWHVIVLHHCLLLLLLLWLDGQMPLLHLLLLLLLWHRSCSLPCHSSLPRLLHSYWLLLLLLLSLPLLLLLLRWWCCYHLRLHSCRRCGTRLLLLAHNMLLPVLQQLLQYNADMLRLQPAPCYSIT
jgi:hypothetical protein